ncbi:SdrD B-like domain-containing protein [Curtobacterium sp. MCJR17_043]|uniref:SdrD B-like domain-containing protein n=1 Tax=Curtobacterium sp. MCJR17_043 TaxID=2175660 RepID=UPI0024DFE15D|nr:SdrD B-like domain-containing protein [Curtobacterium sp. MCJR17_043]WIB36495.1 SdrD B-like domain-containing protein [Curtobacterium sp. MCJR17_043]
MALATEGEQDGDTYANRFGLSVAGIRLPVQSNRATIRVVAGAIGDRVWSDRDGDGLQGADEPGVEAVDVRLTGTDDSGGGRAAADDE